MSIFEKHKITMVYQNRTFETFDGVLIQVNDDESVFHVIEDPSKTDIPTKTQSFLSQYMEKE